MHVAFKDTNCKTLHLYTSTLHSYSALKNLKRIAWLMLAPQAYHTFCLWLKFDWQFRIIYIMLRVLKGVPNPSS